MRGALFKETYKKKVYYARGRFFITKNNNFCYQK